MPDKKISELDAITGSATAADDFFIVVDSSGASTNKISRAELNNAIEQDVLAQVDITSANIDGGTIDNTPIGSATPSTGVFTDLTATGTTSIAGVLSNVVEDTTPQLGGNLDTNGNDITGTGNLNLTGTVTADGLTVDGNDNSIVVDQTGSTNAAIKLGNPNNLADNTGIYFRTSGEAVLQIPSSGDILIRDTANINRAKFSGAGDISFYSSDGLSQGLYWDASTQRLGLGNTSPNALLEVNGGSADYSPSASGTGLFHVVAGATSNYTFYVGVTDDGVSLGHNGGGSRYLRFDTNETERMRITSGGNVGIGADSPSTLAGGGDKILHIKDSTSGNFAELVLDGNRGTTSAASGAIAFGNNGTGIARIIGQPDASSATKGAILFDTHNGSSFQEAARIDSSQNLLVGKTSIGVSTVGVEARGSGILSATRSGGEPLTLNRTTSDGTIIDIKQGGSTVGSIGSRAGVALNIVLDPRTSGCGLTGVGQVIRPTDENGTNNDNIIDLGSSSHRFKDLYLSGGVYLGGTGSANLLDDYEEGTWTPTYTTSDNNLGSVTYDFAEGKYTKIGNVVYCFFTVRSTAITIGSATGAAAIDGLPFTASRDAGTPQIGRYNNWNTLPSGFRIDSGTTIMRCTEANNTGSLTATEAFNTGGSANFADYTFFYYTDS